MSLAFARRRQAEAKKRELKNAQGNVVGEKKEAVRENSNSKEEEGVEKMDAGPKQKGKNKKAQKDS